MEKDRFYEIESILSNGDRTIYRLKGVTKYPPVGGWDSSRFEKAEVDPTIFYHFVKQGQTSKPEVKEKTTSEQRFDFEAYNGLKRR